MWDDLAENPSIGCRRHPVKNIHWRYAERFPYRVIYEINEVEQTVRVGGGTAALRERRDIGGAEFDGSEIKRTPANSIHCRAIRVVFLDTGC